jgi:hypothetical protein
MNVRLNHEAGQMRERERYIQQYDLTPTVTEALKTSNIKTVLFILRTIDTEARG